MLFMHLDDEKKGILFGILAALSYSIMAVFVKLSVDVPIETLVFFRTLICFVCILPAMVHTKTSLKTTKPFQHALRSLAGLGALYSFYYASKRLILVDSILLLNTSPLFMPLVVYIWMRTKITKSKLFALIVGFLGVILVLKPEFQITNPAGYVALNAGLLSSIAFATIRRLSHTEPVIRILFYFFTIGLIVSIFPMAAAWTSFKPYLWTYVAVIGFGSFLFQIFMTKSYAYLPATQAASLGYFSIMFSGIFGWLIWQDIPDIWGIIGMVLIIGCGLYVIGLFNKRKT